MCAEKDSSAHGRRRKEDDGGKDARFHTQDAEWQLTPGGRSRPRLVSGRGPAVRLGRIGRRPYPVGVSCFRGRKRHLAHTEGGTKRQMGAKQLGFAHGMRQKEVDVCGEGCRRTPERVGKGRRVRGGAVLHT